MRNYYLFGSEVLPISVFTNKCDTRFSMKVSLIVIVDFYFIKNMNKI